MDENYAKYYEMINAQQQKNNAWSAEQAQKAMDWQAQQSATAHQREVADLKAAGLNPVLSAGGSGATTGSGIAASAGNENVTALYGLAKMALESSIQQAKAQSASAKERLVKFQGKEMPQSDAEKIENLGKRVKRVFESDPKYVAYDTPVGKVANLIIDSLEDIMAGGISRLSGMKRSTASALLQIFNPNKLPWNTAKALGRAARYEAIIKDKQYNKKAAVQFLRQLFRLS